MLENRFVATDVAATDAAHAIFFSQTHDVLRDESPVNVVRIDPQGVRFHLPLVFAVFTGLAASAVVAVHEVETVSTRRQVMQSSGDGCSSATR